MRGTKQRKQNVTFVPIVAILYLSTFSTLAKYIPTDSSIYLVRQKRRSASWSYHSITQVKQNCSCLLHRWATHFLRNAQNVISLRFWVEKFMRNEKNLYCVFSFVINVSSTNFACINEARMKFIGRKKK